MEEELAKWVFIKQCVSVFVTFTSNFCQLNVTEKLKKLHLICIASYSVVLNKERSVWMG